MNPEIEKIDEAREYLDPDWNEIRANQALSRVKQGYARRRTARIAGGIAAVATLCLAIPFVAEMFGPQTVPHHDLEVSANSVEVSEGFSVVPLDPTSSFSVTGVSDEAVHVDVTHGNSHFDIVGTPDRTYVISAFGVEIEGANTSFDIDANDQSVTIHLHQGSLAVSVPERGEAFIMRNNESRTIALEPAPALPDETADITEPTGPEAPTVDDDPAPEPAESVDDDNKPKPWRELARRQDFLAASDMILDDPELVDRKKVEELFDAADAMRRSGHHEQAADYLKIIATTHDGDSRAGMAAHTRGRILSRRMNDHCGAAGAFGDARALGLEGMLDRDALAHQAEALINCGEGAEAQSRIEEYREEYPGGPHLEKLERLSNQ